MSNCLFFAIKCLAKRGGKIHAIKSKYGPWLHFSWERPDGKLFHYSPVKKLKFGIISKILFKGIVEEFDRNKYEKNN